MTNRDEVAELADRIPERQAAGRGLRAEFEVDFGALTEEEQDEYVALM